MPSSLPPFDPNPTPSTSSVFGRSRLSPDDAYYKPAPSAALTARKRRERARSSSRKRRGHYKKLLWFKQPFPDNYTDELTFLDHLQRNPRLQPYEFWSLVADSTVIVQHVASVAIYCCCFTAIVQERVSPVSVVTWASLCTIFGWGLWDYWMGQQEPEGGDVEADDEGGGNVVEKEKEKESGVNSNSSPEVPPKDSTNNNNNAAVRKSPQTQTETAGFKPAQKHKHKTSATSFTSNTSDTSNTSRTSVSNTSPSSAVLGYHSSYTDPTSSLSPRNQRRLSTAKSALLIYAALLGLSPILKSLTMSTSSDSIWAISTSLLCMNVAFFDYGEGTGAHLPASISTNSALMASTVLASRLESTTHVFSLTLFSIEVFGLFPIFRRELRATSWNGHMVLTIFLIISACGGVFMVLTGGSRGAWLAGVILGGILTFFAMGVCSWWLIGLQKYKNEIHGPWDPARPIIRRRWD